MSKEIIGGRSEDLELLVMELTEIKDILREASQQIRRIERRIKAALPKPQTTVRHKRGTQRASRMDEQVTHVLVDRLKEKVRNGENIESELHGFLVKYELNAIARTLGMTNTKLPPKDELIQRISTRLRQSVAVSAGIDAKNNVSANDTRSVS